MSEPDILCETRGAAGYVVLNRPKALNAITHGMVRELGAALDRWEGDGAVTRIVLVGAGERAFSAGGDIRALYDLGRAGRHEEALAFWRDEYRLNIRIARYPKPYVSLIDGLVMGGGVGLSLHGRYRAAGDRYALAMPEVSIGFFPDVGATFALPRLPDAIGTYIALTGDRIGPDDATRVGLATHRVPSERWAALLEELVAGAPVDAALATAAVPAGPGPVESARALIATAFAEPDVAAVLAALDAAGDAGSDFARRTAELIRAKSPTSLRIAAEQMRRGRGLPIEDAMAMEFRIVTRIIAGSDFYEGVRAALIDRDGAPRWQPAHLADVSEAAVAAYFDGLGPREFTP